MYTSIHTHSAHMLSQTRSELTVHRGNLAHDIGREIWIFDDKMKFLTSSLFL